MSSTYPTHLTHVSIVERDTSLHDGGDTIGSDL